MNDRALYQIGEVAERVGLSLRTLRYYEEVGLVTPSERSPGGFRLYGEQDIERARFVKQLKPLDFSLDEIRELLELRDRSTASDVLADDSAVSERVQMFIATAEERSRVLRDQADAATALAAELRRLIRRRTKTTSERRR